MENTHMETPRMSSGVQKLQTGAREIKDAAMDQANQLKDAAVQTSAEFVQRGADAVKQCCDETEAMVKAHPFQSLLIACGVGALVGMMLLRR